MLSSTLRRTGALLLLGIGAVHLYVYFADDYRVIPAIGPLFAANFAVAVVLAVALLAPTERLGRAGPWLPRAIAAAGAGFALATIAGLEISEARSLFGFHEDGYRPSTVLSLALEAAAAVALAAFAAHRKVVNRPPA